VKSVTARESQITRALASAEGDATAGGRLLPLVYEELKALAHVRLARAPAQTLATTDLVHECWMRLAAGGVDFESRRHFFGAAANAMRNILVEEARRRSSLKRDASRRVELPTALPAFETALPIEDVLTFDEALARLERDHARAARVVGLRFFTGLSMPEVAEVVDASLATVERDWRFARAWLQKELERAEP